MKKIINKHEDIVAEMSNGIVSAHPELTVISKYRVIRKKALNSNKVTLISGGGSGHEPAHAGFIGEGLLDAAVCGEVFSSPSQMRVYGGITECAGDKGVLLIIKNYSGDIMNFTNAAHMAAEDGVEVDFVKVDDDIAVQDSLYTVGRRGVAGTIFVHKVAGAAAEMGMSLTEVKRLAEKTAKNVKSIGFALTSCTVPAKGSPTFELGGDEIEYGVGIHGEPGIRRESIAQSSELAKRMTDAICDELKLQETGDNRVALLINGFGATPLMELYILNNDVTRELSENGYTIARTFVGNFMTSLDMSGASVSVLLLDEELERLLNAPCSSPALKISGKAEQTPYTNHFEMPANTGEVSYTAATPEEYAYIGETLTTDNMIYIVDVMAQSIIKNEVEFCELDSHAGDGDFGASVASGFRQLKSEWESIIAQPELTIGGFLNAAALVIMEYCGGASGPIWGSAFRAAARRTGEKSALSVRDFADMLTAAVKGIQDIGERSFGRGAVLGDKTLIDALIPCAESWDKSASANASFINAFADGAKAATDGAEKTRDIVARMGRAGALGERSLGHPDAGAHALGVIFTDIANSLR